MRSWQDWEVTRSRIAAAVVDLVVLAPLMLGTYALTQFSLSLVVGGLYYFLSELFTGRTPGKKLFGLQVVGLNRELQPRDLMFRNFLRVIDFLPLLYLLGFAGIMLTPTRQRLGDLVAGTIVIRVEEPRS